MVKKFKFVVVLSLFASAHMFSADILFFNQDCNNDIAGADNTCFDERYNMLNTLTADGHTITLLGSFNDPTLAALLAANDFLVIPDLEETACNAGNTAFIDAAAIVTITNYVNGGGSILVSGGGNNVAYLNSLFSLSLTATTTATSGNSIKNVVESANTPFESCPSTFPNLNGTFLVTSSMPSNKRCLYTDQTSGDASVAYFNVGAGAIMYIAYDMYDGGPGCTQAASSWLTCILESAVTATDTGIINPPVVAVPTFSEWGLAILTLLIGICFVAALNQKSSASFEAL